MSQLRRLHLPYVFFLSILLSGSGCTARKVSVDRPVVTFQTDTYLVIQTSRDNFTVLTRSKAAIDEINKRLGCTKTRVCAGQWSGELWTIQRSK